MSGSSDEPLSAPVVFQCGACHRVVSDSNQLLAAVADLGVLCLDAVVGVRIGDSESGADRSFAPLHCSACEHPLGRIYREPPRPELEGLVHTNDQPRYSLLQSALASYVLGSAAVHGASEDALATSAPPGEAAIALNGAAGVPHLAGGERLDVLETNEASTRMQLTQLMRVVLALDQRLRSIEEERAASGGGGGDAASHRDEPASKRPR